LFDHTPTGLLERMSFTSRGEALPSGLVVLSFAFAAMIFFSSLYLLLFGDFEALVEASGRGA